MVFNRHWCEHNTSVTIYVREHEWMEVGAWVYKHFDEVCGMSFLPYSDSIYQQAPLQPISAEEYLKAIEKFPHVDFQNFRVNEHEDNTTGTQTLACTAGGCELA